jgi:hypothetical protein
MRVLQHETTMNAPMLKQKKCATTPSPQKAQEKKDQEDEEKGRNLVALNELISPIKCSSNTGCSLRYRDPRSASTLRAELPYRSGFT